MKKAMKEHVIDVQITRGIQLQVSSNTKFKLDTRNWTPT